MIKILSGEMAIELHLQFLIRNNNTDLMILKNTKVTFAASVMCSFKEDCLQPDELHFAWAHLMCRSNHFLKLPDFCASFYSRTRFEIQCATQLRL